MSEQANSTGDKKPEESNPQDVNTKLAEYEKVFLSNKEKINTLENDLKNRDAEIASYKKRLTEMENEIAQAQKIKANRQKEAEEVDSLKSKSEETLTKAKSIIFEKMKVIKNQELQIEALGQQTESLKDVVRITKDLLEIRNLEVKQLETKINCMEEKIKAEKDRQDLMHKKLETMIRHNGELKREYEAQLILFQTLRQKYGERELAQNALDSLKDAESGTSQVNGEADGSNEAPSTSQEKKEE